MEQLLDVDFRIWILELNWICEATLLLTILILLIAAVEPGYVAIIQLLLQRMNLMFLICHMHQVLIMIHLGYISKAAQDIRLKICF